MQTIRPLRVPMARSFASAGVKPGVSDMLMPILKPFSYIKSKMDRIDNAREAYEACSRQFLEENHLLAIEEYQLKNEFPVWFSATVLHLWMLNARLRTEGRDGTELKQEIFNMLWLDVEIRLHKAGIKQKLGVVVGELLSSYYGQTLAYDEGLALGDSVFASALWRNMYQNGPVSAADLESLTRYVRQQLQYLDSNDKVLNPTLLLEDKDCVLLSVGDMS
ncbi:hypothetical protein HDU67_004336 [Dinochytrium kinnereticum]|nr:hypothetical protein HDU67_004336 [Dinochytrium kinnereticum]